MADISDTERITHLESRISELEVVQQLLLRILSITRPLDGVLEHYGGTETRAKALYQFLDSLCERARGPARDRPSFPHFVMRVDEIFPDLRGDREFLQLLIDTLKVERPAYRELHRYMTEQGWPKWST